MYDRGNPPSALPPMTGVFRPAQAVPLAAPRPGYPTPIANLDVSNLPSSTPSSGQSKESSQMRQVPQALRVTRPPANTDLPRMPPPIYQTAVHRPSVPSTPHPLQPPMTPITPVFARPSKSPTPSDVKFSETIIRGNSEDNLLPKRGERGDHFWRRFSMIAREEKKPSSWLTKTQNGTSRLSRSVWLIGILLLLCTGIGVGLWYHISHSTSSNQAPTAIGGSANEKGGSGSTTAAGQSSSSPLVTPTFTVARRNMVSYPTPIPFTGIRVPSEETLRPNFSRHSKKHWLRNL